jgi:hypothetical protein
MTSSATADLQTKKNISVTFLRVNIRLFTQTFRINKIDGPAFVFFFFVVTFLRKMKLRGKLVPLHVMKIYGGSGGISILILNLGARWK